jgi:hypothetical protein
VTEVVRLIEAAVGRSAVRELLPMQPGDVPGDLRGRSGPGAGGRLPAQDPDRRRDQAFRRVVPGLCGVANAVAARRTPPLASKPPVGVQAPDTAP